MPASATTRLRVRYSECDMQGHVFNANWLSYFDIAITELWRERFGPWSDVTGRGFDLVVAEARVGYRSPARFDDEIDITATIEHLGTTSIRTGFVARRGEETLVEGTLVHVVVTTDTYAKTPIPDEFREALA